MMDLLKSKSTPIQVPYASLVVVIVLIGLGTFLCKLAPPDWVKNTISGPALGTSYNISYLAHEELDYQKEIDSVFKVVNQSLSTYIPTSDITKVNRGDNTLQVDHMFKEVFTLSKQVYQHTKGYFDPTVGALVNAWGFGPEPQIIMDSTQVDSVLQYVGFNKVALSNTNTVLKENPNIYFDFNAIAKGYAIDRLALMLENKGITAYLVEVGGEVVAKGKNEIKNSSWSIGVDDPQLTSGRAIKLILDLDNKAMASSGNYRKFRIDSITGNKYVHTIDPKTGYTKNANVLAATVIAANCATADAYATAFMAMDLADSKALLAHAANLDAYIIYLDADGETKEFMTPGFKSLVH